MTVGFSQITNPADTGHKLNVIMTFRRPGRLMYVQFTSCDYGERKVTSKSLEIQKILIDNIPSKFEDGFRITDPIPYLKEPKITMALNMIRIRN